MEYITSSAEPVLPLFQSNGPTLFSAPAIDMSKIAINTGISVYGRRLVDPNIPTLQTGEFNLFL